MPRSKYSQWYTDRRWREKRRRQLEAEPLCRFCKQRGVIKAADVADHITPHRGDRVAFWTGALESLCHTCHSSIKQRMERGKSAGSDEAGNPLDQGHPWNG